MMTIEEKLRMYREKKNFIYDISFAFIKNPKGHSVEEITYELLHKKVEDNDYFNEWIIVHFEGGAKSYRYVNCNSNLANFRAIGEIADGGYYGEQGAYERQLANGFKKVDMTKLLLTHVEE